MVIEMKTIEKIQLVDKIVSVADKMHEFVKVVRAFLKGYETFISELKGKKTDEN